MKVTPKNCHLQDLVWFGFFFSYFLQTGVVWWVEEEGRWVIARHEIEGFVRNVFIFCSWGEERISTFFNVQINNKNKNMLVIQAYHKVPFVSNFFFSPKDNIGKVSWKNANNVWFSCYIVFIHLTHSGFYWPFIWWLWQQINIWKHWLQ